MNTFFLIVLGQIISLFGNAALRFALPLYLLRQTGSAALYGGITALAMLPALAGMLTGGALATYISDHTVAKFQPMNVNFGIIEPLGYKIKGKREKNTKISERALEQIEKLKGEL